MYVNARAIIEREVDGVRQVVIQVRRKPGAGEGRLELPGGRVEEFESLVSALTREVREETGLEVTRIEGMETRLETGSPDANVECLAPFAAYQTLRGPVDSIGVYFRCQAAGQLLETGDETEGMQWVSVRQLAERLQASPETFSWVDRAGLQFYLRSIKTRTTEKAGQ